MTATFQKDDTGTLAPGPAMSPLDASAAAIRRVRADLDIAVRPAALSSP
jgi:hypothetical protein